MSAARRIASNSDSKPGVVIATLTSREYKDKVMKAKNNLKNLVNKKLFIHNDQPEEERLLKSSLRVIVEAVNHGNANLSVRGNRVVRNNNRDSIGQQSTEDRNNDAVGENRIPKIIMLHPGVGVFAGVIKKFQGGNQVSSGESHIGNYRNRGGNNGSRTHNNGSRRDQKW